MPAYKCTKDKLILGVNPRHVEIIDEMTSSSSTHSSTEHLLKANSRLSVYSECHKEYYTIRSSLREKQQNGLAKTSILSQENYLQIEEPPLVQNTEAHQTTPSPRAFKNLIILGCAFMFMFTAFVSLQGLQSTLNSHQGVGVVSLSCVYAATVVSCFVAPAIIARLTTKWTIVLGYALFLLYVVANFYPVTFVMIPASILIGLLTGPLWSAQSTYLTTLAINYAQTTKQIHESTINHFNGVFCGLLQTSQIWGNLMSATILSSDNHTVHLTRLTINESITRYVCGSQDCSSMGQFFSNTVPHYLGPIPMSARILLLTIHLGCAFMAIALTVIFLDKNELNTTGTRSLSLSSQQLFFATMKMLQDPRLQLLFPLVAFTGLEQGFVMGDFTKGMAVCLRRRPKISYVP